MLVYSSHSLLIQLEHVMYLPVKYIRLEYLCLNNEQTLYSCKFSSCFPNKNFSSNNHQLENRIENEKKSKQTNKAHATDQFDITANIIEEKKQTNNFNESINDYESRRRAC